MLPQQAFTIYSQKPISMKKVKVGVNGYGVIGKRVADAVSIQDDMELVGICDTNHGKL